MFQNGVVYKLQYLSDRKHNTYMIGSTDETEEDEKKDRHCESTGQAVKPSKPDGAVVAVNSICDDAMWNILEVLSS